MPMNEAMTLDEISRRQQLVENADRLLCLEPSLSLPDSVCVRSFGHTGRHLSSVLAEEHGQAIDSHG